MIAWQAASSAGSILRQRNAFSLEIDILILFFLLFSFRFSWLIDTKDNHAYFADAQEHGSGLSSVKCEARLHMGVWDMTSTLCSLRTGAHPQRLIVLAQGQIAY